VNLADKKCKRSLAELFPFFSEENPGSSAMKEDGIPGDWRTRE